MQLRYGLYQFGVNATDITSEGKVEFNQGGQAYAVRKSFHVKGYLDVTSQADSTAKQAALLAALIPFKDLVLLQDDGSVSADILLNAGSSTGVRVTHYAFPQGNGPEHATLRTFELGFEAEYPLLGTANFLLSFHETLRFSGGGPVYVVLPAIVGPAQRQRTWASTPYVCVQSGEAVGYRKRPNPPPPKFPLFLSKSPDIQKTSPERKGYPGFYEGFGISWSYEFASPTPLALVEPSLWIS